MIFSWLKRSKEAAQRQAIRGNQPPLQSALDDPRAFRLNLLAWLIPLGIFTGYLLWSQMHYSQFKEAYKAKAMKQFEEEARLELEAARAHKDASAL